MEILAVVNINSRETCRSTGPRIPASEFCVKTFLSAKSIDLALQSTGIRKSTEGRVQFFVDIFRQPTD